MQYRFLMVFFQKFLNTLNFRDSSSLPSKKTIITYGIKTIIFTYYLRYRKKLFFSALLYTLLSYCMIYCITINRYMKFNISVEYS